ncbi:hypothetical protein BpHYR1_004704 [Brachionus plicatilis]|uniref:Secreted protein n=1 Tax=Brachionus plicatilis TaxID=10195 RepID=A0A3M7T2H2_BRAPC|nr:hypothetical protein BpHYR1_004704 [Brachionus plicatilis]
MKFPFFCLFLLVNSLPRNLSKNYSINLDIAENQSRRILDFLIVSFFAEANERCIYLKYFIMSLLSHLFEGIVPFGSSERRSAFFSASLLGIFSS